MTQTTISLEVVNFQEELKRVEREVIKIGKEDIKERVDFAVRTLRQVTPVDTGEARSGWRSITYSTPTGDHEADIINDVEHIVFLNDGHSKQAPKLFIEQVLLTIGLLSPS